MPNHSTFSNHFLDTNVLLGLIIRWNSSSSRINCQRYMSCNSDKHISHRVRNEAEKVLNRNRRITNKYLEFIQTQHALGNINQDINFHEIKMNFINEYNDQEFPEGMERSKFEDLLNNITLYFEQDMLNFLLDLTDSSFRDLAREIRNDTSNASIELDNICIGLNIVLNPYNDTRSDMESDLIELGLHSPDHFILLDCQFFSTNHINMNLAFITSDNGILNAKSSIESLLPNLSIFKP